MPMDNFDSYGKLVGHNSMLDCQMNSLQHKMKLKKDEIENLKKTLLEEEAAVLNLENDLKSLCLRESAMDQNIQGFRHSKMISEQWEINLRHQLHVLRERNSTNMKSKHEIIDKYNKMADSYLAIYESLPLNKEKKKQKIEIKLKTIQLNQQKYLYDEYRNKISLLKKIEERRLQVVIIDFASLLIEREHEYEESKKLIDKNRILESEILVLKEQRKNLLDKLSTNAIEHVTQARQREGKIDYNLTAQLKQAVSSPMIMSIKEKLGISNLSFSSFLERFKSVVPSMEQQKLENLPLVCSEEQQKPENLPLVCSDSIQVDCLVNKPVEKEVNVEQSVELNQDPTSIPCVENVTGESKELEIKLTQIVDMEIEFEHELHPPSSATAQVEEKRKKKKLVKRRVEKEVKSEEMLEKLLRKRRVTFKMDSRKVKNLPNKLKQKYRKTENASPIKTASQEVSKESSLPGSSDSDNVNTDSKFNSPTMYSGWKENVSPSRGNLSPKFPSTTAMSNVQESTSSDVFTSLFSTNSGITAPVLSPPFNPVSAITPGQDFNSFFNTPSSSSQKNKQSTAGSFFSLF